MLRPSRDRGRPAWCASCRCGEERIRAGDLARAGPARARYRRFRREKRATSSLALDRVERAVGKDDAAAGLDQPRRRCAASAPAGRRACRCRPATSSRARRDAGARCRSTSRARRAARRRTVRPAAYFSISAWTISASQPQPFEVLRQPRQPVLRGIDRGDLGAGKHQLRGLAAGRGAKVGDALAGDVAEQPCRQGSRPHPAPTIRPRQSRAGRRPRRRASRPAPSRSAARCRRSRSAQRSGSDLTVKSTGASTRCAARIACAFSAP